MDSENDIYKMCRLCLAKEQVDVHIFEEESEEKQIFLKISTCLPIKISLDDRFPKKICTDCSCKLDAMYQFWNKSISSESQLLTWLDLNSIENASTPDNRLNSINLHSHIYVKEEPIDCLKTEQDIKLEVMEESYDDESYNRPINEFPDQESSSRCKRKRDTSPECEINSDDDPLAQDTETKCVKLTYNHDNLDVLEIIDWGYPSLIYTKSNYFHNMEENNFYRSFRLTKQTCLKVLTCIQDKLDSQNNVNNYISPMNQLLITLRFYASCGHFSGMNTSTIMTIILRVSEAIARLCPKFIKMPESVAERQKIQNDFLQIASFPNIIGAIDCTHVKILSPPEEEAEIYKNRKSYYSLSVQVISNANLDMINIVARWPGSVHDERIFSNSLIRARMENEEFPNSLLLGYNGYSLKKYFLTPVINPTSRAEELYNEAHMKTRNLVTQLCKNWKRRFPVLVYGMRLEIDHVQMIIVATGVLQNIAHSMHGLQIPPLPEHLHNEELEELIENSHIPRFFSRIKKNPEDVRNAIIKNYFHNL